MSTWRLEILPHRLHRPAPHNHSTKLKETLRLLIHVYDDTRRSSSGCSVNGYKFLCNGNRTFHYSVGNALRNLVGQGYKLGWLTQRADFVQELISSFQELELPCTHSARSLSPSLKNKSTQCASSWRFVEKARLEHHKSFL